MNLRNPFLVFLAATTLFALAASSGSAQETSVVVDSQAQKLPAAAKPSDNTAVTTTNPKVPLDYLELLLEPLTRDDLQLEAEAWRELVKQKLYEISQEEISTRIANAASADNASESIAEKKEESLQALTGLREEKTELTDRLSLVLDNYEQKGGDPTEYRQYVLATLGFIVDSSDSQAVWSAITGWFKSESGGRLVLKRIASFAAIMVAFWFLSAIIGKLLKEAIDRQVGLSDLLKKFINKMVRRTILFIGLLIAITSLGVNVSALFAMIGGGAFVIGFALQDTLSNLAAGLMVLIYRPFDVGDLVELSGVEGTVDSVSLVSTTIRTLDNKVVLVPNSSVWGQVITNATASDKRRVDLVFGIGYDDDAEKAQLILETLVEKHKLILEEPEPTIKLHELADSSVNFICRPWTNTEDYWTVYWDLTRQVKKAFDANEISIPYPQQDVHYHESGK
tara:strand:+ start:2342 stop:3697 length:1356 start_codon:yes stop_codon:yes gene_type:complete